MSKAEKRHTKKMEQHGMYDHIFIRTNSGGGVLYYRSKKGYYWVSNVNGVRRISKQEYDAVKESVLEDKHPFIR